MTDPGEKTQFIASSLSHPCDLYCDFAITAEYEIRLCQ